MIGLGKNWSMVTGDVISEIEAIFVREGIAFPMSQQEIFIHGDRSSKAPPDDRHKADDESHTKSS